MQHWGTVLGQTECPPTDGSKNEREKSCPKERWG